MLPRDSASLTHELTRLARKSSRALAAKRVGPKKKRSVSSGEKDRTTKGVLTDDDGGSLSDFADVLVLLDHLFDARLGERERSAAVC